MHAKPGSKISCKALHRRLYYPQQSFPISFILLLAIFWISSFDIMPSSRLLCRLSGKSQIAESDKLSLLALKKSLNDTMGVLQWDGDDPCKWQGIVCSGGRVTNITVMSPMVTGSIPPEIGDLAQLQWFVISSNMITGSVPLELSKLKHLEYLDISYNMLTGTFSDQISGLFSLKYLSASYNSFSGPLPSKVSNLTKLEYLYLNNNEFSGSIPSQFGTLENLKILELEVNRLNGSIPFDLSRLKNLQMLNLGYNLLEGSIFPELGNLESLNFLFLSNNSLTGHIPRELGKLHNLMSLSLSFNALSGRIPVELKGTKLDTLNLDSNFLEGEIPGELIESLSSTLTIINFSNNTLTGTIPPEFSLCSGLSSLILSSNALEGNIPSGISASYLGVSNNRLNGSIPKNIYESPILTNLKLDRNYLTGNLGTFNCSFLMEIDISYNSFYGDLSKTIFHCSILESANLSNNNFSGEFPPKSDLHPLSLKHLFLEGNRLSGQLGPEIEKFPLTTLVLANNSFSGTLPSQLQSLSNLTFLNLSNNGFRGGFPKSILELPSLFSLDLSSNQFLGNLSQKLCPLNSSLAVFSLANNRFYGTIPSGIKDCGNMTDFSLRNNSFTSEIPSGFGVLSNLVSLDLSWNFLSGSFPDELLDLTNLKVLDLSYNNLEGNLPNRLPAFYQSIESLQLDYNSFSGNIPTQLGRFTFLKHLDLSSNALKGEIAENISLLSELIYINLSHNYISGRIPTSMGRISVLETLDLSVNSLSGAIPSSLGDLKELIFLNLSSNQLSGKIPVSIASQFGIMAFFGNPSLCGDPLDINCDPKSHFPSPEIISGIVCALIFFAFFVFIWIRVRCKRMRFTNELVLFQDVGVRLSVDDIHLATDNFSKEHLLGKGGFGDVYSGTLPGCNIQVAIKRMSTSSYQGNEEFYSEMNTLGKLRHRNLVQLIGGYINSSNGERLLIYEFMKNGSLEILFNNNLNSEHVLNSWKMRMAIALGIAKGLNYLHHQSRPPIIHRDLKPSNVLLDENFRPCISDFGLARALDHSATHYSTRAFGTVGYMSVEYARKGKANEKSDVYALGIILLQLVTGKRPIDEEFQYESLGHWVEHNPISDILDPRIHDAKMYVDDIKSFVELGLLCTSYSSKDRPSSADILNSLECLI